MARQSYDRTCHDAANLLRLVAGEAKLEVLQALRTDWRTAAALNEALGWNRAVLDNYLHRMRQSGLLLSRPVAGRTHKQEEYRANQEHPSVRLAWRALGLASKEAE